MMFLFSLMVYPESLSDCHNNFKSLFSFSILALKLPFLETSLHILDSHSGKSRVLEPLVHAFLSGPERA